MGNAVSPQAKENERRLSREYKRRLKGTCRICGAETSYAGRPGKVVSDLCHEHAMQAWGEARIGKGSVQQRILDFCSEPRRYSTIGEALGIPSNQLSPTLNRLLSHGLLERVRRGVYVRTPADDIEQLESEGRLVLMAATTLERIDKAAMGGPKFEIGAPDECWPWQGYTGRDGYGRLSVGGVEGKYVLAHRLVFRLLVGRIPDTYQLDHLCRYRSCVNPAHLEVVTNRENALRRPDVIKARTRKVCIHGHVLDPDNIYVRPNGSVRCRTCKRDSVLRFRAKNPDYWKRKGREHRAREREREGG